MEDCTDGDFLGDPSYHRPSVNMFLRQPGFLDYNLRKTAPKLENVDRVVHGSLILVNLVAGIFHDPNGVRAVYTGLTTMTTVIL